MMFPNQVRNLFDGRNTEDFRERRFCAGARQIFADEKERRALRGYEKQPVLGGAAEIKQVGALDDQERVQPVVLHDLLNCRNASVDCAGGYGKKI